MNIDDSKETQAIIDRLIKNHKAKVDEGYRKKSKWGEAGCTNYLDYCLYLQRNKGKAK